MFPREKVFRFGPFTFSRAKGLYRGRRAVPLRHLERQIVKCLIDRAGEIIRKEELIAALWPDSHVAANTLNVHISRLRTALGDTKKPHRMVKAYPRMGYMLVAEPQPNRVASLESIRARGDKSKFVRDVTVPDGSLMAPGEQFEKIWEIQNAGSAPWRGRQFRRVGASSGPGRMTSDPLTPVPKTEPGQICLVRLSIVAPSEPGSYYAAWKMIDSAGNETFPKQRPLFVSIDVVVE